MRDYWTSESWGSGLGGVPKNWKQICDVVNDYLEEIEDDDDFRIESERIWENLIVMDRETLGVKAEYVPDEVYNLACKIDEASEWNMADCEKLCKLMGMEAKWEAADSENFEEVMEEAISDAQFYHAEN